MLDTHFSGPLWIESLSQEIWPVTGFECGPEVTWWNENGIRLLLLALGLPLAFSLLRPLKFSWVEGVVGKGDGGVDNPMTVVFWNSKSKINSWVSPLYLTERSSVLSLTRSIATSAFHSGAVSWRPGGLVTSFVELGWCRWLCGFSSWVSGCSDFVWSFWCCWRSFLLPLSRRLQPGEASHRASGGCSCPEEEVIVFSPCVYFFARLISP